MSMPAIAAVLAYITYSASGHQLLPASLFSSLTLFNLLRVPLLYMRKSIDPLIPTPTNVVILSRTAQAFSSITDAANAAERLSEVFEAELLEKTHEVNEDLSVAIQVKDATFTWDSSPPDELDGKNNTETKATFPSKHNTNFEAATISANASSQEKARVQAEEEDHVFQVRDISMEIQRGKLVALVGPVGSGKTSLLQGLIGEMRKTNGCISFGGSVGYCPQSAWIQVGVRFFYSEWLINYLYV